MSDWDASRYDRVSNPQVEWGRRVILRLSPRSNERVLDLGCGTGRLTAEIGASVPDGAVVGFDRSAAMLGVASQMWPAAAGAARQARIWLVRGDGTKLPFARAFDAVFSTATLHWIGDHEALFQSVFEALRPGGRFVAQCGGGRNLERLYRRCAVMMVNAPYADSFLGWRDPWHFAETAPTHAALLRAGFVEADASLEFAPVTFEGASTFAEFISCVCVRHHIERLPGDLQRTFVSELTSAARCDDPPYTLDYWRLNISARRPPA